MKHAYNLNLRRPWKKVILGCIFVEFCYFFCSGARKLVKPKHIFGSPEKTEL